LVGKFNDIAGLGQKWRYSHYPVLIHYRLVIMNRWKGKDGHKKSPGWG
jgi:hypothetical protein